MARQKKKTCLYCYAPLSGRRDAKTCSDRCRKRLQRARLLLERDLTKNLGLSIPNKTRPVKMSTSLAGRVAS
jgi:hypothetical protein